MRFHRRLRIWLFLIAFVGLSLACSALAQPLSNQSLPGPTRTRLPTFTPTPAVETAASVIQVPADTPETPPTEPPAAAPEPLATNTPFPEGIVPQDGSVAEAQEEAPDEELLNEEELDEEEVDVVEEQVVEAPPPAPEPAEPPPTPTDAPAEPSVGAHGVIGKITFRDGRNTYGVGEKVFVKIEATNVQGGQTPFGILGLTTSTGAFQTSWSSGTINNTFNHEDGLAFSTPGNHKMWLSICFSSKQVCQGADGEWERFEPGLDVIIQ